MAHWTTLRYSDVKKTKTEVSSVQSILFHLRPNERGQRPLGKCRPHSDSDFILSIGKTDMRSRPHDRTTAACVMQTQRGCESENAFRSWGIPERRPYRHLWNKSLLSRMFDCWRWLEEKWVTNDEGFSLAILKRQEAWMSFFFAFCPLGKIIFWNIHQELDLQIWNNEWLILIFWKKIN